jgi:general secretion pathway protein F
MEFDVIALLPGQGASRLRVTADSAADLPLANSLQGAVIVSATPVAQGLRFGRPGKFHLPLFSRQLLSLLEAGLNIVEGLETLAEQDKGSASNEILNELLTALRQGLSLSAALKRFPEIFPELYIATIKASERTGDMPEALRRYLTFDEKLRELKKKLLSAAIYPTLLLVVGALVTLFLLGFVVPRFALVFADGGRQAEGLSALLFLWGQFVNQHALELVASCLLGIAGLAGLLSMAAIRALLARLLWRLPAIGERLRIVYLARFYRTIGMLLRAGIPLRTALVMVSGILPAALREGLDLAIKDIEEGQSFSDAALHGGLSTQISRRMIAVGEKSGQLGNMLESVASFYDEEINRLVDTFSRLFEPLLMAGIGTVIGGIVLLLYMPIFELAGTFQ